jgi:hypothetical protein
MGGLGATATYIKKPPGGDDRGRPLFPMRLLLSTSFVEDQISKRHESDTCCRFAANAAEID